jgi:C4-dicarboxylate transporter, DctM subunit
MNRIGKNLSHYLDGGIVGLGKLGGFLAILNAFLCTYEVLMRYVFNAPTTWVAEVTVYIVFAASFLPLGYVLLEKAHVKVDVITGFLSARTALIMELLTSILALLFCLILDWQGARIAFKSFASQEVSATLLKVPMFIPQAFIPLGGSILTIQFVRHIKNLFTELYQLKPGSRTESAGNVSARESTLTEALIPAIFVAILVAGLILLKVNSYLGLTILFFVLLFSGMPVSCALGLFGVFGFYFLFGGAPMLSQVGVMAYSALDSTVTVSLPLFVFAGDLLRRGQMGAKIFAFANTLVRHLPGGLGIASVIFCCLFAAMTGSSVAVAATVSLVALPEMLARGYSRNFVIGLLAGGGTLGILFPPSLPLILYGAMTGESIGSLFAATLIPGVTLALILCTYVYIVAKRDKNIKRESRASIKEVAKAFKDAAGGLGTVVIIMGGIISGIFTPIEAGAVASVYTIIITCFIFRTVSWEGFKETVYASIKMFSMIMLILIGANMAGQVLLMAQIPHAILGFVQDAAIPAWVVILLINIVLILLGGPLESFTILVITLPILYPLVTGLGFSGLWFAVIMVINMEMALISPPSGLNIFILQQIGKATSAEVFRGVIPFCFILAFFLALISFIPSMATWLPSLIMK